MAQDPEYDRNPRLDMEFTDSNLPRKAAALQQKRVEERIDHIGEQVNELSRLSTMRFEKLAIKLRMVEEKYDNFYGEIQKKVAGLNARSSERPKMDLKIEELIEKQNQVVRSFENRLNQLKKIVEGQEVELIRATNELQEARREIAKLKRL